MQLSDTEKKIVERLKKRQQSLIRWRWVGLIGALVYIGVGCFGVAVVQHFLRQPDLSAVLALTLLIPLIFLLVCFGTGLMVYVVLRWNGNPETRLLLRLIEDSQHDG